MEQLGGGVGGAMGLQLGVVGEGILTILFRFVSSEAPTLWKNDSESLEYSFKALALD